MNEEVERAIKHLVSQIEKSVDADDALKNSQAALNLAECQLTINACPSTQVMPEKN